MKYKKNKLLQDYHNNKLNKLRLNRVIKDAFKFATKTSYIYTSHDAVKIMLDFDEKIKKLEFEIEKFEILFNSLDLDIQYMIEYIYNSNCVEFAKSENLSIRTVFRRLHLIEMEWIKLWQN